MEQAINIDMSSPAIQFVNVKGIWHLLLSVASASAEERGAGIMEPIDLIVAIYIVDLEHVLSYWDDWKHFERLVLNVPLFEGKKRFYLHRSEHLFKIWSFARETAGQLTICPPPSLSMLAIVETARKLAQVRDHEGFGPTSLDFLFAVCSTDLALSKQLQEAGLQLLKLEETVKGASST